jgi:hypothetical protein
MTKKASFIVTMWILLILLISNFKVTFSDLYLPFEHSEENSQFRETIYLYAFIGLPMGDLILVRNVMFEFENLSAQPPVNISLPGVWDHFRSATLYVGYNFLGFYAYYDSQIDINITKTHAKEAAEEFLKAFNYTDLTIVSEHEPSFNNSTGTVNFFWGFGPIISKNMETVEKFLKYKPNVGFGSLINKNFLNLYLPGAPNTGLVDLKYDLVKNMTSGSYSWELTVGSSVSELFLTGEKSADLNKLLGNDKPITAVSQGLSRVRAEISNRTEVSLFKTERYILTIQQVSPPGYIATSDVNNEEMIYDWFLSPNSSMDNVVVTFQTDKLVTSNLYFPIELLVPVICAIILSITAVYLIYRYKHKKVPELSQPKPL